jgi:NAD(P)-dependent dehydrogenase (short-subunit alcohol dehydrogenase family)
MTTLLGKTALVTDASRGIGRASALPLAKAGDQATVHYESGTRETAEHGAPDCGRSSP